MVPVLLSLQIKIISTMAKRTFSQTQLGFIAILWVILAGYVLMNAEINGITIISLIMSAIIVFVTIYKNLRK
jgi:hypothetical protein